MQTDALHSVYTKNTEGCRLVTNVSLANVLVREMLPVLMSEWMSLSFSILDCKAAERDKVYLADA